MIFWQRNLQEKLHKELGGEMFSPLHIKLLKKGLNIMKNNKIISNKVKELESVFYSKLREYGECVERNGDVEVILEENVSCEYAGYILEELLGVEVMKKIFCWEEDYLSRSFFKIGTREIDIVKGKSLDTLFGEIKTAIAIGLKSLQIQFHYMTCIANDDGFGLHYDISSKYIEKEPINEIINWINSKTYCDDKFEEIIQELGFEICIGEHEELGETKYIDVSCFIKDAKIWLEEGYKQHTLYREVRPRESVEVLYLLNALKHKGNIFSDEY